jgi:hypothetical protein
MRFVIEAAARENVSIGIVEGANDVEGACACFTWAPRETTPERQRATEASYRRVVEALLDDESDAP